MRVLGHGQPVSLYTYLSFNQFLQCFQHRMWSNDGIETVVLSDNQVQCISTHLTTFAVLVDHRGLINDLVSIHTNHWKQCQNQNSM